MSINKKFLERVNRERIVDTRRYRYCVIASAVDCMIARCPIDLIGTTGALDKDNWTVVARY